MTSRDMAKYAAMRPYFEVVAEGLKGLVDGTDFFDMHAEDVVVEYVITVPDYPRTIVGREALAELYSDYGDSIVQSGSSEVYRYYDPEKSVVVLEYTMHGTVVSTGAPYLNRFISVITVKDRKITHWRDYLDPLAISPSRQRSTYWWSGWDKPLWPDRFGCHRIAAAVRRTPREVRHAPASRPGSGGGPLRRKPRAGWGDGRCRR
jgi:ketosteroid isomerase-like protein